MNDLFPEIPDSMRALLDAARQSEQAALEGYIERIKRSCQVKDPANSGVFFVPKNKQETA